MSAVAYKHKMLGFDSPLEYFSIKAALRGIRKSKVPDSRKPVSLDLLAKLVCEAKRQLDAEDSLCFSAVCCVLFFGFFRISELLGDARRGIKPMRRSQVVKEGECYRLRLLSSKCSKHPVTIKISTQQSKKICPVRSLSKYLKHQSRTRGALFKNACSKPLTIQHFRRQLSSVLRSLGKSPSRYPPHSFRIGAASYAAAMGLSDAEIRQLGRWRSSAFLKYVRHYRTMSLSTTARPGKR